MIPTNGGLLGTGLVTVSMPSKNYKMDLEREIVAGTCNGQEAMRQVIYKILLTERYAWLIYSWNYGVELEALFGMPVTWCVPEIERRIREALLQDDRITAVDNFQFDTRRRGTVAVTFTAHTVFGDVNAGREVLI